MTSARYSLRDCLHKRSRYVYAEGTVLDAMFAAGPADGISTLNNRMFGLAVAAEGALYACQSDSVYRPEVGTRCYLKIL